MLVTHQVELSAHMPPDTYYILRPRPRVKSKAAVTTLSIAKISTQVYGYSPLFAACTAPHGSLNLSAIHFLTFLRRIMS